METFDAIVVGGGPAGSTCAWALHRAGLKVAVIDRAVFPRDKVCAGWITPGVVDLVDLDVEEYRAGRVFQPIVAFRTALMGNPEIVTRYREPVSFGIRRCEFDHYLLRRSGAHVRCGQPVSSLRRVSDRWIVNDQISAPILVGAGGHFCPVARRLNGQRPTVPVVATLEMEVRLRDDQLAHCTVLPDTPALYFCRDLKGYGWCFRKDGFLNVGLGRQDPHHLPGHTHAFVAFLKSQRSLPQDLPAPSRGHAYLLYDGRSRQWIGDGVLVVGDAAGLAEPYSGEGIKPAIESGLLAARTILGAGGKYGRERLEPYRRSLEERFAARGLTSQLARAVPPWFVRRIAGTLMESQWFTRHVLLDRWFLRRSDDAA